MPKRLHKKPITDGHCRQWRKKLCEVLEIDGWKVRNMNGSLIVEKPAFRTTVHISGLSGCVCGNVRFSVNRHEVRVRSTFVRPPPHVEGVEITFAPTEDALALAYVVDILNATANSERLDRCSAVPPTMQVRYQYTAAAWENCQDCFKQK